MKKLSILIVSMLFAFQTQAQGLDTKKIYFGGGLSINSFGFYDSAIGYQIFAGIPLPVKMKKAKLSAEVGYMDSGDFDGPFGITLPGAQGLWLNAVVEFPVNKNVNLIGRGGLDLGDDSGLMLGGGIGIAMDKKMDIRFEYVIRDFIKSLQANIVIKL